MISLIITKKKLHVFFQNNNESDVFIKKINTFDRNESLKKLIETHLPNLLDTYHGIEEYTSYKSIPISVIVKQEQDLKDNEIQQAIDWIKNNTQFRFLLSDKLGESFIRGMLNELDDSMKQDYVILEALDDFIHVSYHVGDDRNKNITTLTIPEVGWEPGRLKVLDYLTNSFTRIGMSLDDHILDNLRQQVSDFDGQKFVINKHSVNALVNGEITLANDKFEDLISGNKESLKTFFNKKIRNNFLVFNALLIGKYFDNTVLLDYFKNDIQLKESLVFDIKDDESALQTVAQGAFREMHSILNQLKEELESKKELLNDRRDLLEEISNSCTDISKNEEYISTFTEKGNEIGIPKEVIIWRIQQTIDSIDIDNELSFVLSFEEKQTESDNSEPIVSSPEVLQEIVQNEANRIPVNNEDEKNIIVLPEHIRQTLIKVRDKNDHPAQNNFKTKPLSGVSLPGTIATTAQVDTALETPAISVLPSNIIVDKIYANTETDFFYFKGKLTENDNPKVFRFISKSEAASPKAFDRFNRLYRREAFYYENISRIKSIKEGFFYHRDFMKGESLERFLKRWEQEKTAESLTEQELQLFMDLWNAIDELPFSFQLQNAKNFLIIRDGQEKLTVKLVGISTLESSKESMFHDFEQIMQRLLSGNIMEAVRYTKLTD